ncbi:hypothetical protein ABXS75_04945 [Roseburia hominis]
MTIELKLVSRILGNSSTQTTRIYASSSIEMMREAMDAASGTISDEEPEWPDDNEAMDLDAKCLFGLIERKRT